MVLPLYYLPNIQYISKFLLGLPPEIEAHEHYNKRSFRNRCHIGTSAGKLSLTIPLCKGKHEQMPIKEVRIDNSSSQNWQRHHWYSIQCAYGKTPFWDYYTDTLYPFFQRPCDSLFDWNADLLSWLLGRLGIETTLHYTNEFQSKLAAENSINTAILISSKTQARAHELDLDFYPQPYTQTFADRQPFMPNMSTIDALFCLGPATKNYIQSCIVTP
jgi:hypothetical protein